ncbi:MAG TPA: HEPN family nuclease [Isosphaeraceae bacterium]|jgi:hypothetical protein|nr:HEPN family nuclease [Isosphaeraceae bacterium]
MDYRNLITDFATRTLANLDLINKAAEDGNADAYEVTQLWNSLLGLIVLPREQDVSRLPKIKIAQLYAAGWPNITTAGKLESETLRGLVGNLRNAVAHFNVRFDANPDGEIQEVYLWNELMDEDGHPLPDHPHRWDGRLDVFQLERLAREIAATYLKDLGN